MTTYISILRGINVGGQKKMPMEKLKTCYGTLGFEAVQTYIQSGNVIFQYAENINTEELGVMIERKIKKKCGFDIPVLVRTFDELRAVVENMPFKDLDETKLHVTFLAMASHPRSLDTIQQQKSPSEEFMIHGREIYLYCPDGYGNTKLSNNFFERKLGVMATTRNWRTVNKLLEMAESSVHAQTA